MVPCDTDVLTILSNIKMQEQNKAVCYDISTSNKDVTIRTAYLRLVSHLTEQNEVLHCYYCQVGSNINYVVHPAAVVSDFCRCHRSY